MIINALVGAAQEADISQDGKQAKKGGWAVSLGGTLCWRKAPTQETFPPSERRVLAFGPIPACI